MADIQPTLDLIDGALGDYLSPDAMRWTPDETERVESNPESPSGGHLTFGTMRRARQRMLGEPDGFPHLLHAPIGDAEALGRSLRLMGDQLRDGMRDIARALQPLIDGLAAAFKPALAAADQLNALKRERMRFLHSSCRQRSLARRRRNR